LKKLKINQRLIYINELLLLNINFNNDNKLENVCHKKLELKIFNNEKNKKLLN